MIKRFINNFLDEIKEIIQDSIDTAKNNVNSYLRKVLGAFIWMAIAISFWLVGIGMLSFSLFFFLSGAASLVMPALFTGVLAVLIAFLVLLIAYSNVGSNTTNN